MEPSYSAGLQWKSLPLVEVALNLKQGDSAVPELRRLRRVCVQIEVWLLIVAAWAAFDQTHLAHICLGLMVADVGDLPFV